MRKRPKAMLFDVFGTLVDWRRGVAAVAGETFAGRGLDIDPEAFALAWRAEYQPAMQPVRDGRRGYTPLDVLHRENLEIVLARLGLAEAIDGSERDRLTGAWEKLPPWPDVLPAMDRLRGDFLLAPCSNGSIALMARLSRFAGLRWDAVLGADIARNYKPAPEVYRASCLALGLEPGQVMMVAAHNDDLVAARHCGMQTGFLPRLFEYGRNQRSDMAPEQDWNAVAADLLDLHESLGNWP